MAREKMTNTKTAKVQGSSGPWGLNRRADTGFTSVHRPTASCSDGDCTGSSPSEASLDPGGDVFYLQDPSAPPLSRGGSAVSWTRHGRKESDLSASSSDTSRRHPWQDRVKPLPPPKDGRPGDIPGHISNKPGGEQPVERSQVIPACRKASVVKRHRPVMSRRCRDTFGVQANLEPRDARVDGVGGCCGLCRAPSALPFCAFVLPCCAYPEELEEARLESSYLIIRENAIEFNNPNVVMGSRPAASRVAPQSTIAKGEGSRDRGGNYIGACGCTYHIRDDARVLFFDDPVLDDIVAIADPRCGPLRRCLCGGRGQAVRVQSRACYGCCVRARGLGGLPFMPSCCLCLCKPAALSYDMPAKDAADAAAKITQARNNALTKMRRDNDARAAVPYAQS